MRNNPDFVGVKLIYSKSRRMGEQKFIEFISMAQKLKEAYPQLVAGLDIAGQEDKGNHLIEFAERLKGDNSPHFFHAGETNWYGTGTDENLVDAVLLNTKRIGHG